MKIRTAILMTLFPTAAMTAMAGEVRLADCPQAVQATINANSRGGLLDDIDRHDIGGSTLYVAEVELAGDRDLKLHIAADGALLKTREDIVYSELPEPVRKAVEAKLAGGAADDVEKEVANGTTTYHVEIERTGQPDLNLILDAGGRITSETADSD